MNRPLDDVKICDERRALLNAFQLLPRRGILACTERPEAPRFVEAAMHARSTHYVVKPEKFDAFVDAISESVPLMRQQKGFHSLLVMRVVGTNPPELRVMTVWESQEALQDSERNVYFYQAVSRALAFSSGFPRILEEEIVLSDFPD